MAVSRALRRLLRVLGLEEEQCRITLESAQGNLSLLERAREAAHQRESSGRHLVSSSTHTGELSDRLAGLEEIRAAALYANVLKNRITAAEVVVAERREDFLAKRIERRQTEELIQKSEVKEAIMANRRGQRTLDDWYLSRQRKTDDCAGN
jgi:flagellar biosynthesis chaperone FliJ